jgi:peptidoglycan/LPS O-acetylase OafA/YrhL
MQKTSRYHELDSLRALAAIGVIGWHYINHFGAAPLATLMAPFYRHGLLFVDFFFVLSGFVLAHSYWREGRRENIVRNIGERVGRLYPLHLFLLLVAAALQWTLVHHLHSKPFMFTFNDRYDFVLHLLLLNSTGLEHGFGFNAASWSISTEFAVNILFFGAIALPKRYAKVCLLAMFIAGVIMVIAQDGGGCGELSHDLFGGACLVNNGIYRTLAGFAVGVAAYGLHARTSGSTAISGRESDLLGVLAIAATLAYFTGGQYVVYSDLAMTLFLFPLIVLATVRSRLLKRALNFAPLVYLGEISYSIYMVHFPLQIAVHTASVAYDFHIPFERPRYLIGFIALTIAVASITYFAIELPGKKAINSLFGKRRPSIEGTERAVG